MAFIVMVQHVECFDNVLVRRTTADITVFEASLLSRQEGAGKGRREVMLPTDCDIFTILVGCKT